MTKKEVADRIVEIGIVPVVRASSAKLAAQAAEAVCAGGIPIVEITMTVPGAIEVIQQLAATVGSQVLIGAGTLTPTEVIAAWKAGSDFVKIFPCGSVGGAQYIKALKAPLPQVPMVPTGGINLNTAADFIQAGSAALGIGGELVSASALASGKTSEITDAARSYVSIVQEARRAIK